MPTTAASGHRARRAGRKNVELIGLRVNAGMSREDLARRCQVGRETIRLAEAGFVPTPRVQFAIAQAFGKAAARHLADRAAEVRAMTARFDLRTARINEGLSQRALAEACDVGLPTIQRLEAGHGAIPSNAKKVADHFRVQVTDLMPIDDREPEGSAA